MTGPDTSLIGGVIAASTLLLLNYAIGTLSGTSRGFRRVVQGEPSLLIHDGKAIESHMAREHVSMDELHRALREHGITHVCDVALAVLEVDKSISCMKYDELNLSALKGEDSQATLRITTLTLAPEGSHRPHASGF